MALSTAQIEKAKVKALDYLEFSIFSMALLLNVDLETLDETFVNPANKDTQLDLWSAYESLIVQVKSHAKLVD
jgi:hypothetical protein